MFRILCQLRALDRERNLPRKGLQQVPLLGQQQPAPLRRTHGEHAERAAYTSERQVLGLCSRQRVGAKAGRLAMVEHPLRDRQVRLWQRPGGSFAFRNAQLPLCIGHQDGRAACKGLGQVLDRDACQVVEAARDGEFPTHRI